MQMILTFLSALPETTGLLIVGTVLMLAGMLLRRIFLGYENGTPGHGQAADTKEHPVS
jgi:hypothetical protein